MVLSAGNVAVVTGGASGIGLGLAKRFGAEGMRVAVADVQQDALDSAKKDLEADGIEVLAVQTDVSVWESVAALRDAVLGRFGAAHIVCNNAGVGSAGDPWRGGLTGWRWTIDVNLMGVLHGIEAFLPTFEAQRQGHFVNTASMAALTVGFNGPYGATKHAVAALSESLWFAMQATGTGVGVSVLCPGWVNTNIRSATRNWPARLGAPPTARSVDEGTSQSMNQLISAGMDPSEVAAIVAEAVRANQFWILTEPDLIAGVYERADTIANQVDPVLFPRI